MKKYLSLFVSIVLLINIVQAQPIIKNGNFEIWENPIPNVERPWFWTTADSAIVTIGNNITTVHKTTDAHGGLYALKITPPKAINTPFTRFAVVTYGINGFVDTNNYFVYWGVADSINYELFSLNGFYKFKPDTSFKEIATISVSVFTDQMLFGISDRWILGGLDTLTPTDTFKAFSVVMERTQIPRKNRDSILIEIRYDSKNTSNNPSGFLIIDDITPVAKVYPTAIAEIDFSTVINFKKYADNIFIQHQLAETFTYQLLNANGEVVSNGNNAKSYSISTSGLASGIYFLKIISNAKSVTKKIVL